LQDEKILGIRPSIFVSSVGSKTLTPRSSVEARPPYLAFVLIGIITVFWGVNFPSIKIAVAEFPVWTFRVICVITGATAMLSIGRLILGHNPFVVKGERTKVALAGLCNIGGFQLCVAFGLMVVDAGRGTIIAYTMPLWATIFATIFLGERLTLARTVGLIIGLSGLLVLIGPDLTRLGSSGGTLLLLAAAVLWGAGTVIIKSHKWKTPIIVLTGWQFIFGGIPILLGMLIFEAGIEIGPISTNALLAIAYSAIVPMIVCHLVWYTLIGMLPATIAAISTLAIPIVGVYSSALLLGERIKTTEWTALCLVVVALFIVLIPPSVWSRQKR
tara:strand:- start:6475 stop:7461 length:987 start_codon:yes stop_codon:yes gene_type:complete